MALIFGVGPAIMEGVELITQESVRRLLEVNPTSLLIPSSEIGGGLADDKVLDNHADSDPFAKARGLPG